MGSLFSTKTLSKANVLDDVQTYLGLCQKSVMVFFPEAATRGVLRNFAKFTGKHLCQGLFFDKFAGLRAATL